jgi:ubiquinol-cytochrome c reductase iron-sulfur subunit
MTDKDDKDASKPSAPKTSAEASGSVFERAKSPAKNSGEEKSRGRTASAKDVDPAVLAGGSMGPDVPAKVRPARKVGRKPLTPAAAKAQEAMFSRPSDDDGTHAVPAEALGIEHDPAQLDPREDKFAERQVSGLFLLAILGVVAFCVFFVVLDQKDALGRNMNFALGASFTVSLVALGAGFLLWAKKILPHDKAVQERGNHYSPEEEELLSEETFLKGAREMQLDRGLLRRTLLGAAALLPIPAVLMLRDLGPLPGNSLTKSGWKRGDRLVDVETRLPIKLGELEIGSIATVMPEGFESAEKLALAPTIIIRFGPDQIRSKKEAAWGIEDHVAYSKICTHAGCPISLYEQQTHHLLCPCHQSTFDMADDANVIFGPAARRLPQLPISIDAEGYFVADGGYQEPVGPSFWERGDANNDDQRPPRVTEASS